MKIIVASCWSYRDTWSPFVDLFRKFWPDCPSRLTLLTDKVENGFPDLDADIVSIPGTWCSILADYTWSWNFKREAVLLLQDDFFFSGPVQPDLIEEALSELHARAAGCVRLYPCPGGTEEYGNARFAKVPRGTKYRISCQASLWDNDYLHKIVAQYQYFPSRFKTPADFEINGSEFADTQLTQDVIAFKRDVKPWPLEYLCTAIVRGRWLPDAKKLCDEHNIKVDWTQREFQQERIRA